MRACGAQGYPCAGLWRSGHAGAPAAHPPRMPAQPTPRTPTTSTADNEPVPEPQPGEVFLGSSSPYSRQQLRAHRFLSVTRDVYVRAPASLDLPTRVRAAGLVLPGSVACLTTAAVLSRLPVKDDGLVHLARPGDAAWSERNDVRVHRLAVRDDEILDIAGLPVTDGPRTLVDLAASLTLEQLVAVGDVVLRRYESDALLEAVDRARRRPGVRRLRQGLPLLDAGAGSAAESRARVRLHLAGYTRLVHGVHITDGHGGWLADPDLADEEARVAVQHDGDVHFEEMDRDRAVRRRRHDVDRDDLCREMGWEVVVSTALDDAQPLRLLRRVEAAYRRAGARWGPQVLPPHLR